MVYIIFVDDILLAKSNIDELATLQSKLHDNFHMKDLGDANHILGMRITHDQKNRLLNLLQKTMHKKFLSISICKKESH